MKKYFENKALILSTYLKTWLLTIGFFSCFGANGSDRVSIADILVICDTCNHQPLFDPMPPSIYYVYPGYYFETTIRVVDQDGDKPYIFIDELEFDMTISPTTYPAPNIAERTIYWNVNAGYAGGQICFTATDSFPDNDYTQHCAEVIIRTIPEFTPPSPEFSQLLCVIPGETITTNVQARSTNGENILIDVTNLPNGPIYTPPLYSQQDSVVSTIIEWTPSLADFGVHTAIVYANSEYGISNILYFYYYVNSFPFFTNLPPPPATVSPNNSYSFTFTCDDADLPYGDNLHYTIPDLPSWLTLVDNFDGTAQISGTPSCSDTGVYLFDVNIEDGTYECSQIRHQTVTITVVNTTPHLLP